MDKEQDTSLSHRFSIVATDKTVVMLLKASGKPGESYIYDHANADHFLTSAAVFALTGIGFGAAALSSSSFYAIGTALSWLLAGMPPIPGRVKPTSEIPDAPPAEFMAWAHYEIDKKKFEAIRADLLAARPWAIYSLVFNNCANFAHALVKRHDLDLPAPVFYFDSSAAMAQRIRQLPESPHRTTGYRVLRKSDKQIILPC